MNIKLHMTIVCTIVCMSIGIVSCEQPLARSSPPTVVVKTTGAIPADIARSRRIAEEWMALWEELATLAEATPGDCRAIAGAWSRRLAGREDTIRALVATSAAESDAMRRRMAARYKARMDRLVPRMTAIREACDGDRAIDDVLAVLEPDASRHHRGHGHAH